MKHILRIVNTEEPGNPRYDLAQKVFQDYVVKRAFHDALLRDEAIHRQAEILGVDFAKPGAEKTVYIEMTEVSPGVYADRLRKKPELTRWQSIKKFFKQFIP